MDLKIRRPQPSPAATKDSDDRGALRTVSSPEKFAVFRPVVLVGVCLALVLLVFFVSGGSRGVPSDRRFRSSVILQDSAERSPDMQEGYESNSSGSSDVKIDKYLGGLLAPGFDESSCLSRYQSAFYRKESSYFLFPELLEKLREHETLQKKCGPETESYKKALEHLKSGRSVGDTECKYVVLIAYSGLGNRILSIASAFLYALLTNRVLLVDRGVDMADLFCEPFPETSWFLPSDFPLKQFDTFHINSPRSYGNMLKNKVISTSSGNASNGSLPSYIYAHLDHDYNGFDKLFFCEDDQGLLQNIPWIVMRSDNYFAPSLFLIPKYERELSLLFPERDTVFHHLGRYLFHPTNVVWGFVTRYFQSYLATANERVGIQIRVFDSRSGPLKHVMDQILACSLNEKVLPELNLEDTVVSTTEALSKSVLITSLSAGYSEKIKNMYWEHPTINGEIVSIYQPSHEGYQQTEKQMHNIKAWAEMYLLSLSDTLITSAWSTFGYVAQGLAGIKPWVMYKPENETVPDPPCRRDFSMEPCFHAPPFYDCKEKTGIDTGNVVPHVMHCEDVSWGLKLVNRHDW